MSIIFNTTTDEEDYNLLPISITLNLTDPVSCVSINIIDDLIFEETETLTVSLTMIGQPISSLALFPDTATLFILNNDCKMLFMHAVCTYMYVYIHDTFYM